MDDTLNAEEAAEFLGVHINTLYKLINRKEIRAVKYFGRWKLSKRQLEKWRKKQLKELTK